MAGTIQCPTRGLGSEKVLALEPAGGGWLLHNLLSEQQNPELGTSRDDALKHPIP
jgi:hypothetical protein